MKKAKIYRYTKENIKEASRILNSGGLVSFPTETVYGLGANALNKDAVEKIFKVKNRPANDPLIVHTYDHNLILKYLKSPEENKTIKDLFLLLAKTFWPGPLTMVLPVTDMPDILSNGTGFVGFRIPNHPVALELLKAANIPVAAPSANKFGHISPTKAEHVLDDFKEDEIFIIKADAETECEIGIESTVIGLFNDHIKIYRLGAITSDQLEQTANLRVDYKQNISGITLSESSVVAPGQSLKHYAPKKPTFILKPDKIEAENEKEIEKGNWGVIDIGAQLLKDKREFRMYIDLSESSSGGEGSSKLFDSLRIMESEESVKNILIVKPKSDEGIWKAIYDRIFRAASGKVISYNL